MKDRTEFAVLSLELHLFFARIMKEHALFLEAGFTPRDAAFAQRAEWFKNEFQGVLMQAVRLSDGIVGRKVLDSGEIVTEFTQAAERQTQRLTGISVDGSITALERRLRAGVCPRIGDVPLRQVRQLNRRALHLVNGLIRFKEEVLGNVAVCRMFTMNYPLLIEHILREAKLYREFLSALENGRNFGCQDMKRTERFWNQIMMEHALFIRGLLDPTEADLIAASDDFAGNYAALLEQSKAKNDAALTELSLQETVKFREFKAAGVKGIRDCQIRSLILPLLADHVLREANHYIRLLEE